MMILKTTWQHLVFFAMHFLHNKMFKDFESRKKYVLRKRNKTRKNKTITLWTEEEFQKLGKGVQKRIKDGVILCENELEKERLKEELIRHGWKRKTGKECDSLLIPELGI